MKKAVFTIKVPAEDYVELEEGDELSLFVEIEEMKLAPRAHVCLDDHYLGELPNEFAEKVERGLYRNVTLSALRPWRDPKEDLIVEAEYDDELAR